MGRMTFQQLGTLLGGVIAAIVLSALPAYGQLRIVATTPTYSTLASELGGNHVRVQSLTTGAQNIHNIVPTPSKMIALSDADLFIHTGLDLELWVTQLLRGSRNRRIQPGHPGNVNCARGIRLKQVPKQLTRSKGDIHIFGNPHYQLDPINIILVARTIRDALKRVDAANAADYDQRYARFEGKMKKKLVEWLTKMRPYRGAKVVVYHDVMPYFADRFGLQVVGYVEPKPGISPTASHIVQLENQMRETGCKVILSNTWANQATVRAVAQQAGARIVQLPEWVGGVKGANDCFGLFDYLIDNLIQAFQATGAAGK